MVNKVVFVTGAASGIGLKIGEAFAKEEANVVISDINNESVTKAASQLKKQGLSVESYKCDVTDEKQLKLVLDKVHARYEHIDILINNAGLQYISPIEDFPSDKFDLLIKVMLKAPFIATKQVFPIMKKQNFGRIINVASINGLIGFAGKAAYNSAKHGVIGLTKVTALEGAPHNITANALCPGYVDTPLVRNQMSDLATLKNISVNKALEEVIYPLVPQKRLLDVDEIASYALFLASKNAGGITGQAVVIDGGYTVK